MNKTLKIVLALFAVFVIALTSFAGGFVTGHLSPRIGFSPVQTPGISAPPTASADQQSTTPTDLQTLFKPFWETWNLIHANYVEQPVDDVALMRGAINS